MKGRKRMKLMTGHIAAPTLPCMGWWLIETEPGSDIFMFSHEPDAVEIMREHNRLWASKHGADAVAQEDEAHAAVCARVREINRERGFTDAEIDDAYSAVRARREGRDNRQQIML